MRFERIPFERLGILVDPQDYWICEKYRVRVSSHGYAKVNTGKRGGEYLHRMILGFPEKKYVDHINGKKLDNRRANLRICTQSENMSNARIRKDNRSGVPGVWYVESERLWYAQIQKERKRINVGYFRTFEEAVKARHQASVEVHKEFAAIFGVQK